MADSQVLGVDACDFGGCPTCDFLPFKCAKCGKKYCVSHRTDHACSGLLAKGVDSASSSSTTSSRVDCAQKDCNKPALISFSGNEQVNPPCDRCRAHFCVVHRDHVQHECQPIGGGDKLQTRNHDAKALLMKNFSIATPRATGMRKPIARKQSKAVQMIKLRQNAKAGESGLGLQTVPHHDRIYVLAGAQECDYIPFWFRRSITTGKAFDLLQSHLKLPSYKTWELFMETDDGSRVQITRFDQCLSEICDEDIFKLRLRQKEPSPLS